MSDVPFWGPDFDALADEDPEIADVLLDELDRLRAGLQLIASENFTSPAVLAALGSTLSQQVRRGLPRHGATTAAAPSSTEAETIGIERAKALFGPTTPTSSRTPARAPTSRPTAPSASPATPSSR